MEKTLLNRKQVSEITKKTPGTVRQWERDGKLPVACKLNGRPLYEKQAVEKLFEMQ
jgi:predicted site-specific integrase-resolvase